MAVTLEQLESHLWGAANILRGSIDAGDYKHYIFGLLFFKRLSDVWDEEFEDRLAAYGDEELAADADEHRFDIPAEHHWQDIRKHTTNIGEHLNGAFHAIEDAIWTSTVSMMLCVMEPPFPSTTRAAKRTGTSMKPSWT